VPSSSTEDRPAEPFSRTNTKVLEDAGCTNWKEYGTELSLSVQDDTRLDNICARLCWSMHTLHSDMHWPGLTPNRDTTGVGIRALGHEARRKL
jgi:hypothetical protein